MAKTTGGDGWGGRGMAAVPSARRGTILIFVLGILAMLALIGVSLIMTTNTERRRLVRTAEGDDQQAILESVISIVQDTLRRDINEEPWDAPGGASSTPSEDADPWLASTLPWLDIGLNSPNDDLLVWPRVSYLGTDVTNPPTLAFQYPTLGDTVNDLVYNARSLPDLTQTPSPTGQNSYLGDSELQGNGTARDFRNSMIRPLTDGLPSPPAGSTARWSIARGEQFFRTIQSGGAPWDTVPFPYFDADFDGVLDLYDADGDGLADSPISFRFPIAAAGAARPRHIYAAIRIIDNASMVNVNSAWDKFTVPGGYQRRGRWVADIWLDPVCLGNGESAKLVLDRQAGVVQFGLADEIALRHRFCLVPFGPASNVPPYASGPIDSYLQFSLLWSRSWSGSKYNLPPSRWARFEFTDNGRLDGALGTGWQSLLDYESPVSPSPAIRRPMFTTVNLDQARPSDVTAAEVTNMRAYTGVLMQPGPARQLYLDWPLIEPLVAPTAGVPHPQTGQFIPAAHRPQVVDVNAKPGADLFLQEYIAYLAGAMYKALTGVSSFQGRALNKIVVPPQPLPAGRPAVTTREMLAWQFAANVCDYRDADNVRTVIAVDPTDLTDPKKKVYGLEQQPFLTETYTRIVTDSPDPPDPPQYTSRVYAVELYVPPGWTIGASEVNQLYLKGVGIPLALSTFGFAGAMSGGPANDDGEYYVFADQQDATLPLSGLYYNASFKIAKGGRVELIYDAGGPMEHVLDGIPSSAEAGGPPFKDWADDEESPPPAGQDNRESIQRNMTGLATSPNIPAWRFTVGVHNLVDDSHTLKLQNTGGPVNSRVIPSRWYFKNNGEPNGYLEWDFDSVVELSRMLMVGANVPAATDGMMQPEVPVTEHVATTPEGPPDERPAGGRIDWYYGQPISKANDPLDTLPWTHRLLTLLSSKSYLYDGVNNDGDETSAGAPIIDEPTEAYDVGYRVMGKININTAPLPVLKALPWLDTDTDPSAPGVELAEAIVARRENRQVGNAPPPSDGGGIYRTVGELTALVKSYEPFGRPEHQPSYYALDLTDLDKVPDFDNMATKGDGAADDVWERDIILARLANLVTVRSDVFTCYIALIDDEGRYLRRTQFTIDRSNCRRNGGARPYITGRNDTNYYEDTH